MIHYLYIAAVTALLLSPTDANALELGEITVASHLGEKFYAEVPLAFDPDEAVSNLFVELASPSEYRGHNVHHNHALNVIRADVKSDRRGNRIELSSETNINAPFIALILKVRYNRATHFKQYPVFLKLTRAAHPLQTTEPTKEPATEQKPAPPVKEPSLATPVTSVTSLEGKERKPGVAVTDQATPTFIPFDGWARTSHYGPVVFGDAIYTIADRLRIDKRYTIRQVMVALFEKNRIQFANNNLNLPQHGAYLDVPMAEEVEKYSHDQAVAIIEEHTERWRGLIKQPQYAVVAEAQKSRYSKRERNADAVKAAKAALPASGSQSH